MAGWQFWIDRGGTFTDIVIRDPSGTISTRKLLSENPERYADAAIFGIREALGLGIDAAIPDGLIECVKMGTTVATNALLERKGAATLALLNRGFADLLRIGDQARRKLFDLNIRPPAMLYARVAEVVGRVDVDGREVEALDEALAREVLAGARAAGIEAVAIALIHAWKFPAMERRLGIMAREAGFAQVSLSHEVSPLLRLVPRADTAVADAYLSPVLRRYVNQVAAGLGEGAKLYFMQSHGGLADARDFSGKDAILSGPAGGIVGAARTAAAAGFTKVIGFDMGGTSTDVALYDGGFERRFEAEVAGVRLRAPMLSINTVAAGGGSILSFDGTKLRVGPESAGANPGPAAYRRGGPLTVTDANILLGKIQPAQFPAIFGPHGDEPLDTATVREKFDALAGEVTRATGTISGAKTLAAGFITIAVVNMAHAIKQISIQKGRDPKSFALACFGGAGGQHACLVADELGMETVFIHPLAGVLSAYGMGLADQMVIREQAVELPFDAAAVAALEAVAARLRAEATAALMAREPDAVLSAERFAYLRYGGTDSGLKITLGSYAGMVAAFEAAHQNLFGFITPERGLIAELVTVEVTNPGARLDEPVLAPRAGTAIPIAGSATIYTEGAEHDALIHQRGELAAGDRINGPALIQDAHATTIVEPGWQAEVTAVNHLILRRVRPRPDAVPTDAAQPDPVLLELFNNLFMAVAEQCGTVLRQTAQSVNIKERLDFSCAIFDASGGLIANAPHVPVHLGAMGASVRAVIASRGKTLHPGDAVALNDPFAGGTHLPDITLITPVFDGAGEDIRFFVACRGHHADIGGLTPGSTPPFSRALEEEGVVIRDLMVLRRGEFQEHALRELLAGARYPARSPDANVADMKAQIAANATGVTAMNDVIARYGFDVVSAYMRHVMDNAEAAIRRAIGGLRDGTCDYPMDNGALLKLRITVDHEALAATIDFTGTSAADAGNFNAPRAVTTAAVLYAFRCLVGTDMPLNEGCLKPLTLIIPDGSFLSPPPGTAVVAGNTEVSQAVATALLLALGACAASQSTMNNFLFGDGERQYYETICGGAGAGPDFAGAAAVHTHMTNTRITDPEVLELRYPVRVEEFSVRRHSGGDGAFAGGDGAMRKLRFLAPMTATVVASRRHHAPPGLAGGAPGGKGRQWVERSDGRLEALPGSAEAQLAPGDAFVIETPGGGGYGRPR